MLFSNHSLVPLEAVTDESVPGAVRKDVLSPDAQNLLRSDGHSWVGSTRGSVLCGLSARMSSGGESPLIIAARLAATAGECMTPWPLNPHEDHTPGRDVSPTSGWWSNVTS